MSGRAGRGFYEHVSGVLDVSRWEAYAAVSFAMAEACWEIGCGIVEQRGGAERAEHGEAPVKEPSRRLGEDFGKGFDERNLRFTRRFYLAFPIRNALRTELSWTHYRRLSRFADPEVRMWCTKECAESDWSTRELMNEGDDPPVGIVPCADKGDSLVEYTLPEGNAQLFAAKDLSRPPSREELALELSAEYRALDEAAVG